MNVKLFDSELKIMEALWREGDITASQLVKILNEEVGWNKNTTYTVIKKCIDKGAVDRSEPNFLCKAVISREEVQAAETDGLIDKMFDGSKGRFFAAFLEKGTFSKDEIEEMRNLIDRLN